MHESVEELDIILPFEISDELLGVNRRIEAYGAVSADLYSVTESFFKTLKQEEIYRKDYRSEKDMLRSITTFMEFYNNSRPHSMNGYRTPSKHEAAYYKRKAVQKS